MQNMIVKTLNMQLAEYGEDKGRLKGKVTFLGRLGEVSIVIDSGKAAKILAVLAEELVATAQDVAKLMVGQIVEQAEGQSNLAIGSAAE